MTRSGKSRQLGEGCLRMTPIKLLDLTKGDYRARGHVDATLGGGT